MRVAVIENTRVSPLGQVGAALREADAEIQVFRPWAGETLPDTAYHDALIVMGGEQNALDDERAPWLPDLARLMRRAGQADKAVLGICLGAQLLARAWGGDNILGATPEFGWTHVETLPAGRQDPVLSVVGPDFISFAWHKDTFTLPRDAAHLARTPVAENQAFRIGRASYGLQFHLEMDRSVIDLVNREFPETVERIHPGWLTAFPGLAARHGPEADAAGLAIARAWVSLI